MILDGDSNETRAVPEKARPSLRDEQKNFTRARLLESAAAVFGEHGFVAATIGQIVDHANASRATFYLHFKDKQDILNAILADTLPDDEAYYGRLDVVLATNDPALLRAWVSDALMWFEDHASIVIALEHALLTGPPRVFLSPDFASYMPAYMSRWPSDQQLEASLRIELVVGVIARVFLMRHAGWMAEAGWDLTVDVLTGIVASTLEVKPTVAGV